MPEIEIKIETLCFFFFLILPGFICNKIRLASIVRQPDDEKTSVFSTIMASAWLLAPFLIIVMAFETKCRALYHSHRTLLAIFFFLIVIIWPLFVGLLINRLAETWIWRWLRNRLRLRPAIPRAWDFFLNRRSRCLMIITLNNGTKIGGEYAFNSFASSFPAAGDIFLEKQCTLDEQGQLTGELERSLGVWIDASNIRHIEMLDWIASPPNSVNEPQTSSLWRRIIKKRTEKVVTYDTDPDPEQQSLDPTDSASLVNGEACLSERPDERISADSGTGRLPASASVQGE